MRNRLCLDPKNRAPLRFLQGKTIRAAWGVLATALAFSVAGAVAVGNQPGGGGFTWGVGIGANCQQVVEKIRRNWMDVRPVLAPDSRAMRPRSRDFFCVSPDYIREAMPKVVPMTTGLKCFDVQGQPFCCDNQHRQCAAM